MRKYSDHLILSGSKIRQALVQLNELGSDAILFVVDESGVLIGSLTDGDVRRGLLNNFTITNNINDIIQSNPRFITKGENNLSKVIDYREGNFRIIPIVDRSHKVVNVINFRNTKSYLPVDAVIMAGGKGQRLKPLTDSIPKPLLKVGEKAIMEHNLDRLSLFGIDDFWISLKYLGKQIEFYFGNGENKNIKINYVWEENALGTIGAVSQIKNFEHDYILVTNSDLLTNLDYEHFFLNFVESEADLTVLTIPYQVNIPYAVMETVNMEVKSFKEKPTYTYYANGGVYLMKKEVVDMIPNGIYFNATDLMESLISKGKKVNSYPLAGYWLDVGSPEDLKKAQVDINQIKF